MLVVVNQPHTRNSFKIEGSIPSSMMDFLENEYGKNNVVIEDNNENEYVNFRDTDWFKSIEPSLTPAYNLAFYRKLNKMTQAELAEKLGTKKQVISDMEHERKPISKKTAKQLASLFSTSVARFI